MNHAQIISGLCKDRSEFLIFIWLNYIIAMLRDQLDLFRKFGSRILPYLMKILSAASLSSAIRGGNFPMDNTNSSNSTYGLSLDSTHHFNQDMSTYSPMVA